MNVYFTYTFTVYINTVSCCCLIWQGITLSQLQNTLSEANFTWQTITTIHAKIENSLLNLNQLKCFINVCFIYYHDSHFTNCTWNSMMLSV